MGMEKTQRSESLDGGLGWKSTRESRQMVKGTDGLREVGRATERINFRFLRRCGHTNAHSWGAASACERRGKVFQVVIMMEWDSDSNKFCTRRWLEASSLLFHGIMLNRRQKPNRIAVILRLIRE